MVNKEQLLELIEDSDMYFDVPSLLYAMGEVESGHGLIAYDSIDELKAMIDGLSEYYEDPDEKRFYNIYLNKFVPITYPYRKSEGKTSTYHRKMIAMAIAAYVEETTFYDDEFTGWYAYDLIDKTNYLCFTKGYKSTNEPITSVMIPDNDKTFFKGTNTVGRTLELAKYKHCAILKYHGREDYVRVTLTNSKNIAKSLLPPLDKHIDDFEMQEDID